MSPLHHLRINVSDLSQAKLFYEPILTWLGFEALDAHYGTTGSVERLRFKKEDFVFLISESEKTELPDRASIGLHHISFSVPTHDAVDRFYEEILLTIPGIKIEDPPITCPEYREGYYATFFFDPDGIKLEVTFTP